MLQLSLLSLLTFSTACVTPPIEPPASEETKPAKAAPSETIELKTEMKETDFGAETTLSLKIGDTTHKVATATGMCRYEAGIRSVLYTVSCFEAGASTDFEVRRVKGFIEVWERSADEGDESSVTAWHKVWTQKS
jgi:hypothetical protein